MIRVVDATLREGEQTPGVSFSAHSKIAIAALLDEIGVSVIEGGHPRVSPEIKGALTSLSRSRFRAKIGAHARTLEGDVRLALDCGVNFLGVFYCVSEERLAHLHRSSLDDALGQLRRVIVAARQLSPKLEIRYTPEDAVRSPFDHVLAASCAAIEAGADVISVADTTGLMVPGGDLSLGRYVDRLRQALAARGFQPTIAVHAHNDRGLALANALEAIEGGATMIDATVLGIGERAGIVDLGPLLLQLEERGLGNYRLDKLPELYALVAREAGLEIPVNHPLVGAHAFTHCAGVHTQAALRDPTHYQSLDPALFGRQPEICLDQMAGLSALRHALDQVGIEVEEERARLLLDEVKRVGSRGRRVLPEELPFMLALQTEESN